MVAHAAKSHSGIDHVIDKQHTAVKRTTGDGNELGNIKLPLLRAGRLAITTGRQNAQRHVVNTRHDVPYPDTTARQTKDLVKLPARFMNIQGKTLDKGMVLIPTDPMVAVSAWIVHKAKVPVICILESPQ